jgi:O-antigen/teichoic acid export membrane protein
MIETRTQKTIRNVQVALIYYFINLALNFFSRKVFIDRLGAEVLGLNTTIYNLLGFINIAELGISSAISYALYVPLFEKDKKKICEIVSVQGWLYKNVAIIAIAAASILMCFFPMIFEKARLPIWYAYATFLVLLFSSLLGYFVNYRQIVLTADQKDYKITIHLKGVTAMKIFFQILAIFYFSNGYMYWLVIELVSAVIIAYILTRLLKREYPWLKTSSKEGYMFRSKYPDIIVKTKQMFAHKIGGFVSAQTSPLIIYGFTSLTLVTIYGNYMLIILGLTVLSNALFNSITAGIGNLIAEGNKKKIMDFFWQLTSFRMWQASVFSFSFYILAHPFISAWLGKEYLLETTPFILLTIYLFMMQTRVCEVWTNAYGLYKDVGAPIIEAILNIGCAIILGYYFELSGVIAGFLVSFLVIVVCWKPYFLFKNAFCIAPERYFRHYLKYMILILISLCFYFLLNILVRKFINIYILLLFSEILIYIICSISIFLLFEKNMVKFLRRSLKYYHLN